MELNICHLYPDILNLYGDRGNIITMKRRLEDRGIKVNIDECSIGQPLNADKYDIFFIGGGQDFEQEVLLRDLSSGKAQDIRTAVEEEKTFLAICGGYQMLGEYYKTWDGVQLDFIGAIGVHTIGAKELLLWGMMLSRRHFLSTVLRFLCGLRSLLCLNVFQLLPYRWPYPFSIRDIPLASFAGP